MLEIHAGPGPPATVNVGADGYAFIPQRRGMSAQEKHYTLEFLQSGVEDRFDLLAGSVQYRFTYHGEADCDQ